MELNIIEWYIIIIKITISNEQAKTSALLVFSIVSTDGIFPKWVLHVILSFNGGGDIVLYSDCAYQGPNFIMEIQNMVI